MIMNFFWKGGGELCVYFLLVHQYIHISTICFGMVSILCKISSYGVLKHSKLLNLLILALCFFSAVGNSPGFDKGGEGGGAKGG